MKILKLLFNKFLYYITGYWIINKKHFDKNSRFNFIKRILAKEKTLGSEKMIIFDVGQNMGQSTDMFLKILKINDISNYEIHAFEPEKKSYDVCYKKFSTNKNIILNNIGLSDNNSVKQRDFYEYENNLYNSLYKIDRTHFKVKNVSQVFITSINKYCEENNINKINFLKIDTEGEEPNIIEGASHLISKNLIHYIDTELTVGSFYLNKKSNILDIENKLTPMYCLFGISNDGYSEINSADQFEENGVITKILTYKNVKIKL